jgi:thiol-disulfide isomerase/thioredoxin
MKDMKRIYIGLLSAVLLASCKGEGKAKNTINEQQQAEQAPSPKPMNVDSKGEVRVNAYNFDGLEHFLHKDNDTTYVVNFWATWCVPCVEELPYFEKLNQEYKDKKVKVLLVSLDMHKMVESKLLPFIKEKNLQSDVVVLRDPDADSWIPKVDKNWTGAIPATVIYKGGKRNFFEKSFTYEELVKEVNNIK